MQQPPITISEQAKAWLQDRGGALTLRYSTRHGCCGGSMSLPVADPEAPKDAEGYTRHKIGDLDIYIAKNVAADGQEIRIGLEGFWKWRRLTVDGVEIASAAQSENIIAR